VGLQPRRVFYEILFLHLLALDGPAANVPARGGENPHNETEVDLPRE